MKTWSHDSCGHHVSVGNRRTGGGRGEMRGGQFLFPSQCPNLCSCSFVANRFHPTVYVHSDDTSLSLLSACWRDKRITFSIISCRHLGLTAGDTEHISLFHICQLYERWSRDDPSPADWCHISWPTLKANCSPASASWDTSRTPRTFTISHFHVNERPPQEYFPLRNIVRWILKSKP